MKKIFNKFLPVGSRSVLCGAHAFWLHPFIVAYSWYQLYGFPYDPRLWFAFFLHDIGYIGKPNMDGKEGELHPYLGAEIMGFLFGDHWYNFTLYHSRFLAKKNGQQFSRLCVADKLAVANTPAWFYLPMVKFTGEIKEYMKDISRNSGGDLKYTPDPKKWYATIQKWVLEWVEEHKDGKQDTWTTVRKARK